MIELWIMSLSLLFCVLTLAYLDASKQFHGIVNDERPDWIQLKGRLSFFYSGMPKYADPKISMAVIRIAFSSRVRQLHSSDAMFYANRIRFLLPSQLITFAALFVLGVLQKFDATT
jgi:hypothetical protein